MFRAGAKYMATNSFSLDLTTLLGYESDSVLMETFDHAGIVPNKAGKGGGLTGALKPFDITVAYEGTEGSNRETGRAIKVFRLGNGPSLHETMQDQTAACVTISEDDAPVVVALAHIYLN
jgi:hypothetical protein